jgi:hypothetical protein
MLYRHPMDVIMSMSKHFTIGWHPLLRRYLDLEDNQYLGYARFWDVHVNKMLDFEAAHSDRCLRVRYEDIVADPEQRMRNMFQFLGEPWDDRVMAYYEQPHDLGRGDRKALIQKGIKASVDNWHSLDPDLIHGIDEIVGETAARLGYECRIPQSAGEAATDRDLAKVVAGGL